MLFRSLLAYHKIYSDFFRNNQWEESEPWTFNADYVRPDVNDPSNDLGSIINNNIAANAVISSSQCLKESSAGAFESANANLFDLRYCDFNKDFILGAFPNSQFGARASVDVLFPQNFTLGVTNHTLLPGATNDLQVGKGSLGVIERVKATSTTDGSSAIPQFMLYDNNSASSTSPVLSTSFDVLSLRYAEALQKYREISLSNDADYKSQIEAHFGVSVPSILSNSAIYLGGSHQQVNFQTIANNNLTKGNEANLQSIGTSSGKGKITFEAKEHGIVMCITYVKPLPEYSPIGFEPYVTHIETDDYVIPEFDRLGQEKIDNFQITGGLDSSYSLYGSRYYDYKSTYDLVLGNLGNSFGGDMQDYSMQLTPDNFLLYNSSDYNNTVNPYYAFFKVPPFIVDSIFFAKCRNNMHTDQFILCDDYTVSVLRNIDRKGMPY